MFPSIPADDRAALRFDELASGLEAGLPLTSLGANPADGDRSVHGALAGRGVRLSPIEDAVVAAGVRAGRTAQVLRERAEQRRQRAGFTRELWAGLRYPLFLLVLATGTSLLVGTVIGNYWIPTTIISVLVLLGAAWLLFLRGLRTGGGPWLRLPWIGPLAKATGELPYLEAMHALYSSGVPIVEAHEAATGTVGIVELRVRLRAAEQDLRAGGSLGEAIAAHDVLHQETRQLVSQGEVAGQLEEALGNALRRRREICRLRIRTTVRVVGGGLYGFAVLAVVFLVFDFYLGYFDRAFGR